MKTHFCEKCETTTDLYKDDDGTELSECCDSESFIEIESECQSCEGTGEQKGCCYGMPAHKIECGCHGGMVGCDYCDGLGIHLVH